MKLGLLFGLSLLTYASAVAGVLSNEASVLVNPGDTLLWHTLTSTTINLQWTRPAGAATTTLRISALGYERTFPALTDESLTLTLPAVAKADDERVYMLTLTHDNGESQQAVLGAIASVSAGDTARGNCLDETGTRWGELRGRAVIPVTGDFTIDGEQVMTGLGNDCGWFYLTGRGRGAEITLADEEFSAVLKHVGGGFVVIIR